MFRGRMLLLIALVASASAGCGSDTDVQLECPSPDGSIVAIMFSHSGGGGAGWFDYELALQPSTLPPTVPKRIGLEGPSITVLRLSDLNSLTLDWESNEHL